MKATRSSTACGECPISQSRLPCLLQPRNQCYRAKVGTIGRTFGTRGKPIVAVCPCPMHWFRGQPPCLPESTCSGGSHPPPVHASPKQAAHISVLHHLHAGQNLLALICYGARGSWLACPPSPPCHGTSWSAVEDLPDVCFHSCSLWGKEGPSQSDTWSKIQIVYAGLRLTQSNFRRYLG